MNTAVLIGKLISEIKNENVYLKNIYYLLLFIDF